MGSTLPHLKICKRRWLHFFLAAKMDSCTTASWRCHREIWSFAVIKSDAFSSHTLEVKDTAELQIDFIKNTSQYQHDMMSILSSLQMLTMVSPQRNAIRFTRIAKLCQKN